MAHGREPHRQKPVRQSAANAAVLRRLTPDSNSDEVFEEKALESKPVVGDCADDAARLVRELRLELQEANAELFEAVRILRALIQMVESQTLSQLARTEQSLIDEVHLMERRIRGDILTLRPDFAGFARRDGNARVAKQASSTDS